MRVCQPAGTWSGDEPMCGKETIDKGYKLQEDPFHVRSFMQSLLTVVVLVILTMVKLTLLMEPLLAQWLPTHAMMVSFWLEIPCVYVSQMVPGLEMNQCVVRRQDKVAS